MNNKKILKDMVDLAPKSSLAAALKKINFDDMATGKIVWEDDGFEIMFRYNRYLYLIGMNECEGELFLNVARGPVCESLLINSNKENAQKLYREVKFLLAH